MPPTSIRASSLRLPRTVWVLGFVSLLMDTSSEMIHALLPAFMATVLGLGATSIGAIEGVAEATALIMKMFSGVISDHVGRRKGLIVLGYGLAAVTKPVFALAGSGGAIFAARFADRVGKGLRGSPRDAMIADVTPPDIRGAAFGLRQSLDTVGAFLGPLIGMGLMLLWANNFRAVFLAASIPAFLAVALLMFGIRETAQESAVKLPRFPLSRAALSELPSEYWQTTAIAAVLTLARFSEAFLVLRAQQGGLALPEIPLVLIVMNLVYALGAYPIGWLADRMRRDTVLAAGIVPLIAADIMLAHSGQLPWLLAGLVAWGLHMAATQGLLAAMVAGTAPENLRGTAFGVFNLASGCAMLCASILAGLLWDTAGPSATFYAGAVFAGAALLAVLMRRS